MFCKQSSTLIPVQPEYPRNDPSPRLLPSYGRKYEICQTLTTELLTRIWLPLSLPLTCETGQQWCVFGTYILHFFKMSFSWNMAVFLWKYYTTRADLHKFHSWKIFSQFHNVNTVDLIIWHQFSICGSHFVKLKRQQQVSYRLQPILVTLHVTLWCSPYLVFFFILSCFTYSKVIQYRNLALQWLKFKL